MWVRRLDTSELAWLQPMFNKVFSHPVSLELLQWKYADDHGESWAAGPIGYTEPFLHCGLLFRDVLLSGTPVRAAQLVDLMAEPKRSGLSREQSPFTVLTRRMLDSVPRPGNPDGVAFGFPSARAMRLGEHSGISCEVDKWFELRFTPSCKRYTPRIRPWQPEQPNERSLADRLWKTMARDFSDFSLGVRDSAHLIRRYIQYPGKKYSIWVIHSRFWHLPVGLAVLGPGEDRFEIVDIICPLNDIPDVLQALRSWLHEKHSEQGELMLMLTSHFAKQLAPIADHCETTQFRIMANPRTPENTMARLRNRWWLTGGDTDYR